MCTERGVTDASPREPAAPEELTVLQQELACPEPLPCTDLLNDPVGVLSDEQRWPKHFCRSRFYWRSTTQWTSHLSVALPTAFSEQWYEWHMRWPLPVGKQAIGPSNGEIFNLVPFEEWEEARWAIRITAGDGTLDLFGLGIPYRQGEERVYKTGELRYDLQGHGTLLC
jgi:hypothetical protein